MSQLTLNNLKKSLKADPKKTGALAFLAVLLIAMIGKALFNGTTHAAAAKTATPTKQAAKASASPSVTPHSSSVGAALAKWSDTPPSPVSRNIFAVRMDYFPVDGSRTLQSGTNDDGFWSRLEKSMANQADQKDKRDNLIANFTAEAGKLKLQSTMMGPQPKALVNGDLVGEGSVVANFRILKIEARRIIVEREGIRLEIQMK